MAVTVSDQDDVPEDGLIPGLHYDVALMARKSSLAGRGKLRESIRRMNIEGVVTAERGTVRPSVDFTRFDSAPWIC
jgi:hypothetical protein